MRLFDEMTLSERLKLVRVGHGRGIEDEDVISPDSGSSQNEGLSQGGKAGEHEVRSYLTKLTRRQKSRLLISSLLEEATGPYPPQRVALPRHGMARKYS